MSHSYKKTPAASTIIYNGSKRRANHHVRRLLKDPCMKLDNGSFKKAYDRWNIRDYKEIAPSFETFYKDVLDRWYNLRRYSARVKDTPPTEEECRKLYHHWYVRK